MSDQVFELEIVGHICSASGKIELGDLSDVQLTVPTRGGKDEFYIVNAVKVNGEVRGYFIDVDPVGEWVMTGIDGFDKPWPPLAKSIRKRVTAASA